MRETKEQLKWQIEVLKLALHMAAFAEVPVRGSQHWLDRAAMELIRRGCAESVS
jgi:hypothetical protein